MHMHNVSIDDEEHCYKNPITIFNFCGKMYSFYKNNKNIRFQNSVYDN